MKTKAFKIEDLLGIPNKLKIKKENPFNEFSDEFKKILDAFSVISKSELRKELFDLAQCNYCTNIVSLIEVFCKRLIVYHKTHWNVSNYEKLVEGKITYLEAFKLMKLISDNKNQEQLTIEHLIAEFSSFSNFESIDSVFSGLTSTKFFNELGKFKFNNAMSMDEGIPNWRKHLSDLYLVRNKFVHEWAIVEETDYDAIFETSKFFVITMFLYFYELEKKH